MVPTPSGVRIEPVDAADPAAVARWHAAYTAADRFDRGENGSSYMLEEIVEALAQPTADEAQRAWVGLVAGPDGEQVVVAGWMLEHLVDNRHRVELSAFVPPEHRRRGHGSAMLRHLEAVAAGEGRTTLGSEASWPHDAPPTSAPGPAFAAAHGYDLVLEEVQRTLELPTPAGLLEQVAREWAAADADVVPYRVVSWSGPVPQEHVAGWALLDASLETEAPTGGLDVEAATPDVATVRAREEQLARQGRTPLGAAALAPTGEVVAYTLLVVPAHEDGKAYQWGTLVRADHRGHRLGLAVKLANLRRLEAEHPRVRRLVTYNAEVNVHMIAVNQALGFRPTERLGEFQKTVAG